METTKTSEKFDKMLFLRNVLKDLEYPNIHGMDENQIAAIFAVQNRQFLIGWLFKKISEEYEEVLENNNSVDFLSQLIYEHGFCKIGDHKDFMTGKLPPNKQLEIFHRIFSFINNILNKNQNYEENNCNKVTLNSIVNLKTEDLNLFPTYGKIKLLSKQEKLKKITEFQKEIEHLEEMQKNSSCVYEKKENKHDFTDEELKKLLEDLKLELPNLREMIKKGNEEMFSDNSKIVCDEKAGNTIEEFCNKMRTVSQYIKGLSEISMFLKGRTVTIEQDLNDEEKMVKILVDELRKYD